MPILPVLSVVKRHDQLCDVRMLTYVPDRYQLQVFLYFEAMRLCGDISFDVSAIADQVNVCVCCTQVVHTWDLCSKTISAIHMQDHFECLPPFSHLPSLPTPSWFVSFAGSPCWPTQASWDTVWKRSSCPGKELTASCQLYSPCQLPLTYLYTFSEDLYPCAFSRWPSCSAHNSSRLYKYSHYTSSLILRPAQLSIACSLHVGRAWEQGYYTATLGDLVGCEE